MNALETHKRTPGVYHGNGPNPWSEISDVIGPMLAKASRGESVAARDLLLVMNRNGYFEETLSLNMCLHELATNATKYGALSGDAGEVSVTWSIEDMDGPRFHFRWIASCGIYRPQIACGAQAANADPSSLLDSRAFGRLALRVTSSLQ